MSEKKWFKVSLQNKNGDPWWDIGYTFQPDVRSSICHFNLFGLPGTINVVTVPRDEVPYKTRAFAEATTEELRDALQKRGYKVMLS